MGRKNLVNLKIKDRKSALKAGRFFFAFLEVVACSSQLVRVARTPDHLRQFDSRYREWFESAAGHNQNQFFGGDS